MATLAVATTEHLLLPTTASLKHTYFLSSSGPRISIPRPLAGTWSPDNSMFFLVFSNGIRKYSNGGSTQELIFSSSDKEELQACVVAKDNGTVICALSDKIAVLEPTPPSSNYNIAKTINVHWSPLTSLAISNDGTVLASASQTAVHIHKLETGSHTVLRGLPQSSEGPSLCTLSPHFPTKLIVGSDQVLYIYDINRPSSPTKTIPLGSCANGDIVSLACSPYSKTLVAAACEGGTIHLIDFEKEKGLFRTVDLKTRITSLVFSPEGAAMYIGTDEGNLSVVNLRSLGKLPRSISTSEIGSRVECLVVQVRSPTSASGASSKQNVRKSPIKQDQTMEKSSQPLTTRSPILTLSSKSKGSPVPTPVRKRAISGVVRNPTVRSPPVLRRSASTLCSTPSSSKTAPTKQKISLSLPRQQLSNVATTRAPKKPMDTKSDPQVEFKKTTKPPTTVASKSPLLPKTRPIDGSIGRIAPTSTTDSKVTSRRKLSTTPSISTASRKAKSPSVPSPSLLGNKSDRLSTSATSSSKLRTSTASSLRKSTTPSTSPEPRIRDTPSTPFRGQGSGSASALQSTDDEGDDLDAEITVKQPNRQQVGSNRVSSTDKGKIEELENQQENGNEVFRVSPKKEATLQVTPVRPGVQRHSAPWPPVPSPLRRGLEDAQHTGGAPSSISNVHNMLQQIMRDVMYDYQEDMRTELVGMHLDMMRMGRNWKKEMKEVMDAYSKDLRELKEENRLLREENERLKRGY